MSDYYNKIFMENPDVAERYRQKLSSVNYVDPYSLSDDDLDFNTANFPPVTNMDIVSYLVLTTSFYIKQQMKAFKSLNAYKYFNAGFITMCGILKINEKIVARGTVSCTVLLYFYFIYFVSFKG